MKELLQAILSRIKSPIFGSALLFYLLYNSKELAIFIWSSNENKLKMIQDFEPNYIVITSCFFASLSYFIFHEWLQVIVDLSVKKARSFRQMFIYQQDGELAMSRYKSTDEYQKKLVDRQLDTWEEEKKGLNYKIQQLSNNEIFYDELEIETIRVFGRIIFSINELNKKLIYDEFSKTKISNELSKLNESINSSMTNHKIIYDKKNINANDVMQKQLSDIQNSEIDLMIQKISPSFKPEFFLPVSNTRNFTKALKQWE